MSQSPDPWRGASVPARWKAAKAGHEVPLTLPELDRLEAMFGGEPNGDSPEASLFWTFGAVRPPARKGGPHSFYLRGYTPPELDR